jgi:hypothetical protein
MNAKVIDVAKLAREEAGRVQAAVAEVPGLTTLTATERKRIVKMRTGAERHIRNMARLAAERAETRPHGVDPAEMLARIERADALSELHASLTHALQQVEDTILVNLGTAYADALDVYALAERQSQRDPSLVAEVAPMQTFLAHGPRPEAPASGESSH